MQVEMLKRLFENKLAIMLANDKLKLSKEVDKFLTPTDWDIMEKVLIFLIL